MRIAVLLGGFLASETADGAREREIELPAGARLEDVLERLGLGTSRVKLMMRNGRGATLETPLSEGDRVAFFPPELSFNTFVSLSFRKERVEARQKERRGEGD
jgi:molybdopterin converting factor small subunit